MLVKPSTATRFKLSLQIAVRFLLSKSRGNFLSLVTSVSIFGVSVGVLALLVVTSVINGYEHELTHVISGTQGDVIFYSKGSPIRDRATLQSKLMGMSPDLSAVTASLVSQVMFSGAQGVAGGVLEGIDPQTWPAVVSVEDKLLAGGKTPVDENEIVLGSALAERLGVGVGERVRVTLPFTGTDDEGGYGSPKVQDFKVSGIVHLGMYDYDSKYAYAVLSSVQQFVFGGENEDFKDWITTFRFKVKAGADAEQVASAIAPHFGFPYKVIDWSKLNKNLLYAIKLEKAVIAVLLTVIMMVAALNVISALLMMVYEKEKEIAILRVLGARKMDHFILFSFLGSFFGIAGTALGVLCGLVSTFLLSHLKLIHLPADIYHLEYLPIVIRWTEWSAIALLAFVICFLATVGPAIQVSRRSPVEGLRWTA